MSLARKSTGLVQRQGQDRRKSLGPCTAIPPCHVPYIKAGRDGNFPDGKFPHHPFIPHVSVGDLLCTKLWALWPSDSRTTPSPTPIHRHTAGTSPSGSLRPPWKLQETAASTQISLSGLANLQRARRVTTSLGNSPHPALGVAWGRGHTAGTAVPGISPLGSGQATQTLCFCPA